MVISDYKTLLYIPLVFVLLVSCSTDNVNPPSGPGDNPPNDSYFPPIGTDEWATVTPAQLQWNTAEEQPLLDFLDDKGTKAFIILKDGRMALEAYFGSFSRDSLWYWASAGKTLTAFTVGLAQEEGLLEIGNASSDYLGLGWTGANAEKEQLITVWHQLTMTTGLNDLYFDCVTPNCLEYLADAGTRWAYQNGPYTLLQDVVSAAANSPYTAYFNSRLRDRIGMNGFWLSTNGSNNVYFSTARSMARFGLLNLREGLWDGEVILGDTQYLSSMKNSSQELNASYGYLWWLNGKEQYMAPGLQFTFNGPLIPQAPADTYSGLGKNDQKLYVVPSKGLVVVRMGEDSGDNLLGPSSFDNALWERLNDLIP